jgi:hypothetical protein
MGAVAVIAAAGCGGGERQDENEPKGDFQVEVVKASFPKKQKLATNSALDITIRNAGTETVPNLAVTVDGFGYRREQPGLADPSRPRFAVNGVPQQVGGFPEARDDAPAGCETAYVSTWACGPLKPDGEKTFRWSVTAVVAGPYEIRYLVAGGLNGKARAVLAGGGAAGGSFTGTVSARANHTVIGPDGKTVVIVPR